MKEQSCETRILVLEKEMQWAKSNMEGVRSDLQELKLNQYRMFDGLVSFQARMDEKFSALQVSINDRFIEVYQEFSKIHTELSKVHEKFSGVYGEISGLHGEVSGLHGEISGLHGKVSGIHGEISGLHKEISEINRSIAIQTRWILRGMMGAVTIISLVLPLVLKIADRYF